MSCLPVTASDTCKLHVPVSCFHATTHLLILNRLNDHKPWWRHKNHSCSFCLQVAPRVQYDIDSNKNDKAVLCTQEMPIVYPGLSRPSMAVQLAKSTVVYFGLNSPAHWMLCATLQIVYFLAHRRPQNWGTSSQHSCTKVRQRRTTTPSLRAHYSTRF